jgi:hypothetical protein
MRVLKSRGVFVGYQRLTIHRIKIEAILYIVGKASLMKFKPNANMSMPMSRPHLVAITQVATMH